MTKERWENICKLIAEFDEDYFNEFLMKVCENQTDIFYLGYEFSMADNKYKGED